MAINQAEIFSNLEKLHKNLDKNEFIYDFLSCYGYAPATITLLKKGDRNVAVNPKSGEVALKNGVYFKPLMVGEDIYEMADRLIGLPSNKTNKIRFVIVTDFVDVIAHDLKSNEPPLDCSLASLHDNYSYFLPLAGYEKARGYDENPADVKAAEQMGRLFDLIREKNKSETPDDIHGLNVFLTRLLFCFFAEDTGIFEKNQMTKAIDSVTNSDGSDVSTFLETLFEVLNEPDGSPNRLSKAAHFKSFPYVNGGLFKTKFPIPEFTSKARRILIDCGTMQWEDINPDIFGSMFQSVIDADQRGNLGQHYTSVTNIMKVIQPLFLDKLHEELERSRGNSEKLKSLIDRLSKIKIFDPACGSGNFLISSYKELRKIEIAAFKALDEVTSQKVIFLSGIRLSQFYGIEIDDFAHEIALLSLWLTEHQMNQAFKNEFGYCPPPLPLKESGNVVCDNSLKRDWAKVCSQTEGDEIYICGNPPFLGSKNQEENHKLDMEFIFSNSVVKNYNLLDYITCWIFKGANMLNERSALAFVSTSSICQGEQVGILWPAILEKANIAFAHQAFKWTNNARNVAAVHCVIIGLEKNPKRKTLFSGNIKQDVSNISPYLLNSSNYIIHKETKPINGLPVMGIGNKPIDDGNYLFLKDEMLRFIRNEPLSQPFFHEWYGADELLNLKKRWCLLVKDIPDDLLDKMPTVRERVDLVKKFRLKSKSKPTQKLAEKPRNFHVENFPNSDFIVIPKVSSENKKYIPVAILNINQIASDLLNVIDSNSLYVFGLISSEMHMLWVSTVGGRFGNGYRYSSGLCYNTFPLPDSNPKKQKIIEELAANLLLIRERYPDKSLGQLYAPETMPIELLQAHKELDSAIENLYRDRPFVNSSDRLEHLFKMYGNNKLKTNSEKLENLTTGELW